MAVKMITQKALDALSGQAKMSPRLRKNENFHASDQAPCHRLLNAIEPDSYVRPHRHLDPAKGETMVIVRGRLGVLLFDDMGNIVEQCVLQPDGEQVGVDIPAGTFHSLVALTPNTVFFEAKAGPYIPPTPEEFAEWAPHEGTEAAALCLNAFRRLF